MARCNRFPLSVRSVVFLLLSLFPGVVLADFITYTGSTGNLGYIFPLRSTSFSSSSTDSRTISILLPKFDPSFGKLESARLSVVTSATGAATGSLRTARSFPTGINANLEIRSTLSPPGAGTNFPTTIPFFELNRTITVPSGQRGFDIVLGSSVANSNFMSFPTSYLPTLSGTGWVASPLTMQFRQEITTSGGTIDYIFSSSVRHDFVLEYGYSSVPEPTAFFVGGLGLIGLICLSRGRILGQFKVVNIAASPTDGSNELLPERGPVMTGKDTRMIPKCDYFVGVVGFDKSGDPFRASFIKAVFQERQQKVR